MAPLFSFVFLKSESKPWIGFWFFFQLDEKMVQVFLSQLCGVAMQNQLLSDTQMKTMQDATPLQLSLPL